MTPTGNQIIFSKITNGSVFTNDFRSFTEMNTLSFSREGMAVFYGPNGTGKTSLARVLADAPDTSIEFSYDGVQYSAGSSVFTVINDQNHRNIIQGSPKDFLLGPNIQREYELQEHISNERQRIFDTIISKLKDTFLVSASSHKLIVFFENSELAELLKALTNPKNKGKTISIDRFISVIKTLVRVDEVVYDQESLNFFLRDYADKNSIIASVLDVRIPGIKRVPRIREVEENTAAISILERFIHKTECVVCDNPNIDSEGLCNKKKSNRELVISTLDKKMRLLIEQIIASVAGIDPFGIKEKLMEALDAGNTQPLAELQDTLSKYRIIAISLIEKEIFELVSGCDLIASFEEYQGLISQKPDISEADFLFIEEIISNSMRKELKVDRDEYKNIKIYLADNEFLGHDRGELHLSSGEQNFLSLAFEFLRARSAPQPVVVLDDPISSFDSIYKNKVVYAIAKILENKLRLILTHNIDMIRLLDAQFPKSFKMYLLNNTDNELNGFIPLRFDEQDMLINLTKLLESFRTKVLQHIVDAEIYLMSMIPFMRGYASICNKRRLYDELTKVMHGYRNDDVDIAAIYHDLFGAVDDAGNLCQVNLQPSYVTNVDQILRRSIDGLDILDTAKYPILNKTLKHSFTYLSLRLIVERTLVEKYQIDTERYKQLGQIIDQAFDGQTAESTRMRVKLTSKKTLINEFNHFEGNLSIFQPAIDITNISLAKEKGEILSLMDRIKRADAVPDAQGETMG